MHHVTRFDPAGLKTPVPYAGHSLGYRRASHIDDLHFRAALDQVMQFIDGNLRHSRDFRSGSRPRKYSAAQKATYVFNANTRQTNHSLVNLILRVSHHHDERGGRN